MAATLSCVIHGESGTGKTTLAATSPAPRLILDCEGGARYIRQRKIYWDPLTGNPPPENDGTWETCVVTVRDYRVVDQVYAWLNSGQHPFKSVCIDSLTEAQKKLLDIIAGVDAVQTQHWGQLLRQLEDFVRKLRDLTFHPTNPIECVVIICLSQMKDGKFRAFVKGQLELTLPGFVDVVGYLFVDVGPNGEAVRKLQIAPYGPIDAKDRTGLLTNVYGMMVENANLNTFLETLSTDPLLG